MHLFVGLGNPGSKYENTPHNAGFHFVENMRDYLGWSKAYDIGDWRQEKDFDAEICFGKSGSEIKMIFLKPLTFMNLSGQSVKKVIRKFEINPHKELIVAHDDLDLQLGQYKIQVGKGPKKHNGIISIESMLSSNDFLRVRVGVDNREAENRMPGDIYVLKRMSEDDVMILNESCASAVKQLRTMLEI